MNETALKERLKVIAKNRAVSFNEIWKQLLLERFLARLSRSKYSENFIFKGGLLLAQRIQIGRETTDIDFLMTKLKSEASAIETTIHEITSVEVDDGFLFEWSDIAELTQPHMAYPGFRVSLHARFGKMRDKIQIDIGIGDLVEPIEDHLRLFEYKGKSIFEGEITLLVYPVETIFSEKLETIISKGAVNSRMKDYHDLTLMMREPGLLEIDTLKAAVKATFHQRGTVLRLPIVFDSSGIKSLQRLWLNHLNGLGTFRTKLGFPDTIEAVIADINAWLATKEIKSE